MTASPIASNDPASDRIAGAICSTIVTSGEGMAGLLVVGKSTAGGRTLGTAHVVQLQGQAAGIAAALAPRHLDVKQVQHALQDAGVERS